MVELMVATAVLAVVFAAIMPVFGAIRNHADAAGANSEMVQNARVLNEQLYRHLAQARRITAVSDSADADGYIELETSDGAAWRCQLGSGGYVECGPSGDLSELAGPMEHLTFVCYDGNDSAVQTDVPSHVRLVTWEGRLDSAGAITGDKTITGACYLRVNGNAAGDDTSTTYDFATGQQYVDCFAFSGEDKPQVPTGFFTPNGWLMPWQYDAIEVQDDSFYVVSVSANSNYAQVRFLFQIDQDRDEVGRIDAMWRGKGVNAHHSRTDGASFYIWDYASGAYELLQASASTEALVTLSGTRTDAPSRYVDPWGLGIIVLLVVSNDKKTGGLNDQLYTDYVRLDVAASSSGGTLP